MVVNYLLELKYTKFTYCNITNWNGILPYFPAKMSSCPSVHQTIPV